jgi:hypothetical protein
VGDVKGAAITRTYQHCNFITGTLMKKVIVIIPLNEIGKNSKKSLMGAIYYVLIVMQK